MWLAYIVPCRFLSSDPKSVADICVPGLIISLIAIRINCFYQGCCIGLFIPNTNFRYPIRELEIVFQVVFLLFSAKRVLRKEYDGTLYPLYMICYGCIRFAYEFFREPENLFWGKIHAPHIWSVISIAVGAIIYYLLKKEKPVTPNKSKKSDSIHLQVF